MPIYEFLCNKCKHDFELLVGSNKDDFQCPHCNDHDIARRLSTFASQGTEKGGGGSSCSGCSSTNCGSCGS